MASIIQKIKNNERLGIIFSDLHLISLLALACFFVLEKKWQGLISFYLHPGILLIFWLITIYLVSLKQISKRDWIQIFFGIILAILILLFYKICLGPWVWLVLLLIPAVLLLFKKKDER